MKPNMKNYQSVESRKSKVEGRQNAASPFSSSRHSSLDTRPGFTLIELLVVISIIAVLAAFTIPVFSGVKRRQYITHTQAELALLETAIERYKSAYGFYPPDSPNNGNSPLVNQLYYELEGTTFNSTTESYTTLDSNAQISTNNVGIAFKVGGFINCTKSASAEDTAAARNFLPGLKPSQYNIVTNPSPVGAAVTVLVSSVGGPDQNYKPFGVSGLNSWRYNSSNPTNNPGAYDLYIQLVISGKTNLICNWSKQVQLNSPLP